MKLLTPAGRRARVRKGASASELAFILPVLVTLALGCVDFGRFAYHYIAVTNAVRAGAEYAVMNPYVSSNQGAWTAQIQSTAQAEMTNQTGCATSNLTTAVTTTLEASGLRRVRVVGTYASFQTLISWPGIPSTLTLRASVEMRVIR